jgi:hypothetical protein
LKTTLLSLFFLTYSYFLMFSCFFLRHCIFVSMSVKSNTKCYGFFLLSSNWNIPTCLFCIFLSMCAHNRKCQHHKVFAHIFL